jgi:hypothetical protein
MLTTNPFAELANVSELISPTTMQIYAILMFLLVVGGTILDIVHKKSMKYFNEYTDKANAKATKQVSASDMTGMRVKVLTSEVLTSSEFSNQKRRLSHLLTMYGFTLFVLTSAIMIFFYGDAATGETPSIWPLLWHLGAIMLCVGGYWFWFAIRVDVAAVGLKWYDIAPRAVMFILSLLGTCTFALLWSFTKGAGIFFILFLISSLFLFGGVYWSKFAHMFFKPAAAYQKKVLEANGHNQNLPYVPDLSSSEVHERFPDIPTYMGKNPPNMGPGIRRESANHY